MNLLFPTLCVAIGLAATACPAADEALHLEWVPSGAAPKFRYYSPHKLLLSPQRPEAVKKLPDGLQEPLFGEITVGPKESPQRILVVVAQGSGSEQRLCVDSNGNGDLTDDPEPTWTAHNGLRNGKKTTTYEGSARVTLGYGSIHRGAQIRLYRADPSLRADAATTMVYYRDWAYEGTLSLGGEPYPVMLDDVQTTGDFRGQDGEKSGVNLLVDVNRDGQFDSRAETFDVRRPFNIGGTTYEITGLTASGDGATLVKSTKTVEEIKPLPVMAVGAKPIAFEAKTTDGKTVRFPEDYKGKVVLLDFWATWCGPCRAELPEVKKVYEDLHPKGFEILAISLDSQDNLDKLAKFTADNAMPWPQVCDGKAWEGDLVGRYGVHGIPAGFLVNGKTGLVAAVGSSLRGSGLRTEVEKALTGGAATPPPTKANTTPPAKTATTSPDPMIAKAEAASKAGRLLSSEAFLRLREKPDHSEVTLPSPATEPLSGRQVAKLARERYLRAGWFYHCTRCDHWHLKLCGAYPIAQDAVATAWHVTNAPATLKEGSFIVMDASGEFLPITAVIAGSAASDALILRIGKGKLKPLALNDAIEVGDAAYLFSDPLEQKNYFSSGIVNRLHLLNDNGAKPTTGAPPASLRLNVSTDWAPGSSGSAVLDQCGNVIGHVATINPLFETTPGNGPERKDDRFHNASLMTLHDAIPAAAVKDLLKQ